MSVSDHQKIGNSIKAVNARIRTIHDPDLGEIGKKLLKNFNKTNCRESKDMAYDGLAFYSSFSYREGQKGFVNSITYGAGANDSFTKLFSAKVHEMAHALQIQHCAALRADPFNPDTKIIICPRDWIMLQERCEEDAYVKQALFNSLLAEVIPHLSSVTDKEAFSAVDFKVIRDSSPNIGVAFNRAARQSLSKRFYWDSTDENYYSFRNHYQYRTLAGFKAGMNMRRHNNESGFVFVRLTAADIMDVGASFGLNSFSGDPSLTAPFFENSPLRPRAQGLLAELNDSLGIKDENSLPTLTEALAHEGLDKTTFQTKVYQATMIKP